ncbi:MAG TPA: type II secretion system F family protein [Trichormus sp.]
MPMFVIATIVFLVVLGSGLLLMQPAFEQYADTYAVRVRSRKPTDESSASAPKESAVLLICGTIGDIVLRSLPGLADRRTVELLTFGNYRTQKHLSIHIGVKGLVAGAALFFGLIVAASNSMLLLVTPFCVVMGWLVPNFFLAGRVKKRQDKILRELPTIIDLLIVCAQAGVSLMAGVDKISKEVEDSCPILCAEMQQLIQDIKLFAKSVPVGLREMGERCGVDELTNMASALIAAEQKGADMSYPLKQQGQALRDRLKRKREEEAAKVPVKMVPVIMIFVMPLILAPMLGPAIVTLANVYVLIFAK